jgi:hypothetical protein
VRQFTVPAAASGGHRFTRIYSVVGDGYAASRDLRTNLVGLMSFALSCNIRTAKSHLIYLLTTGHCLFYVERLSSSEYKPMMLFVYSPAGRVLSSDSLAANVLDEGTPPPSSSRAGIDTARKTLRSMLAKVEPHDFSSTGELADVATGT